MLAILHDRLYRLHEVGRAILRRPCNGPKRNVGRILDCISIDLLYYYKAGHEAYAENDKPSGIATHCSHSDNPVFDRVLDRSLHYTVCHLLSLWITFRLAAPMDSVGCAVLPRRSVPSDILCWAACPAGVPDIVPQLMSAIVRSATIMLSLRAFRPPE